MNDLAHEALSFLKSYHDGDPRFMDRLAVLERLLADVESVETAFVVYLPGTSEPVAVSEDVVEGGQLMTTANTFADPPPDVMPEIESIAQAEKLLAQVPEIIGGKKKK